MRSPVVSIELPTIEDVTLYPNPANVTDVIHVDYKLNNEAEINIVVYDGNGGLVGQSYIALQSTGLHTANLSLFSMQTGLFTCVVTVVDQSTGEVTVINKTIVRQ